MTVSDICIYFIIAILGLAYPISLGVVTRLDEKYKSINITRLFRQSRASWAFQAMLFAALGFVLIQIVWVVNFRQTAPVNLIYYDWADICLVPVTTLLVVSFFYYTNAIYRFYVPLTLARDIQTLEDDADHTLFKAIADLLYTGIEMNDEQLIREISSYNHKIFKSFRDDPANDPNVYPFEFYDMVYKTIFRAAHSSFRMIQDIGDTASSGRWFIGSTEYSAIDKLTFSWMWNNLSLVVRLERDDYVLAFWKNSHQFISTGLKPVPFRTNRQNLEVLNREEIDKRELERAQFFEFHTAFGGMLLFKNKYALLKTLFNHTTGIPLRHELLPVSMTVVFHLFFRFWSAWGDFYIGRYQFPDTDGIQGEFIAKEWISRYTALLLIRQYHTYSQWYGYEPVERPQIPEGQDERQTWISQLQHFKRFVIEVQNNDSLLKALGYKRITADWAAEKHLPTPEDLIEMTIQRAQALYNAAEVDQQAEENRKELFYRQSANILSGRLESYTNIQNPAEINNDYTAQVITGGIRAYNKAAFATNQPVTYMNYDTFFGNEIASQITRQVTQMFRDKANPAYLFPNAEIFQAIDRLKLDPADHYLLNFGVAIEVVNATLQNEHLTPEQYKGIPIISIGFTNQADMRSSLIAIRRSELPRFYYPEIDPSEIRRFDLQLINEGLGLYGAVIDLNEQPQLKVLFPNETAQDLNVSVLLNLDIRVEVRWKNNVKLVRLSLYNEAYDEPADVSDLEEVQVF